MRSRLARSIALLLVIAATPVGVASAMVATLSGCAAFSPNGDGRRDTCGLSLTLDAAATVDIHVTTGDGGSVTTVAEDLAVPSGTTTFAWDGTDALGLTVADATYTITATADAGSGPMTSVVRVDVDTRAPQVRWREIAPEPLPDASPFALRITTRDAAATLAIEAVFFDDEGEVGRENGVVRTGRATVKARPRYASGAPWLPGLYRARVVATDPAGNRTQSAFRVFRNHRPDMGHVIHRLGGTGGRVALTFDDCGDGGAWGRILRILDERNAHASFFCLTGSVAANRAQARRTVADGHTIGSHSTNHAVETRMSFAEIVRQNRLPQDVWWKVARTTPAPFFRPPYGSYDAEVVRAVGSIGYARTILWDVDPRDWEHPGTSALTARVLSASHSGSIVVLHTLDGTAAALPGIIAGLRAKGLEPVSLAELFHATGLREPADLGPVLPELHE